MYDWEQRKLGDTFEFSVSTNSLSRAQLNYEKGNIKSIHYGDILIKYNSILEITKDKIPFITDGSIEKYKPNLLENGDVVFADAAEDETVGKAVEINGISDEYVVAGLHTIVARPKEKMAKYFSGYYINADVYQRQLLRLMQGTKVSSISKGNLKKTIVAYPKNLAEQQKIGSFFKQLDNAIALHQRKLEKSKALKSAYLSEMFPAEGERKPKRRFAGFTDDWEQRKWSETVDISTEMVNPKTGEYDSLPHIGPGNIESFTGRILDNVKSVKEDNLISGKFHFYPGDVIYGKINPQLGKYAMVDFEGLASADSYVLNTKNGVSQTFLFTILQGTSFYKYSVSVSMRTGMPKINRDELNQYSYSAPSIVEQEKIGHFFQQLDDTSALHQEKIAHLKVLKTTLLNKMFI